MKFSDGGSATIVQIAQVIPLVGGPADGQWIVMPEPPALVEDCGVTLQCGKGEYQIWTGVETPDEKGHRLTAGEQLWAAISKDILDTFTFNDVAERFYAKIKETPP